MDEELINIFERGVQLPTHGQWVDVPGSPFQVMCWDTDLAGTFRVRINPDIRPELLNHWSCWS